jgi:hypothetical protein
MGQLNVAGAVTATPSTTMRSPRGKVSIVTALSTTPYRRRMPSMSVVEYWMRCPMGMPAGIDSIAGLKVVTKLYGR